MDEYHFSPIPCLLNQQIYYDLIMGSSSTSAIQGNNGKRGLIIGSRPVHSFMRNLTGKEGRIRGNLLGKRVYYISRSTHKISLIRGI